MKTLQTIRDQAASITMPTFENPLAELQLAGNQVAQAAMTGVSEMGGFLDSFAASDVLSSTPSVGPFSGPEAPSTASNDQTARAPFVKTDASHTMQGDHGAVKLGTTGFAAEVGTRYTDTNEVLGTTQHDNRFTGGFGTDGVASVGARTSVLHEDGDKGGVGAAVDSKGRGTAGVDGVIGGTGVKASAMVDVDEQLRLEAMAISGGVSSDAMSLEASLAADFGVPQRDGNAVAWDWGLSQDLAAEFGDVGMGSSLGRGLSDQIVFPTEEAAEAFEAKLNAGEVGGRNRYRDAWEIMAFDPGTQLSYAQKTHGGVNAKLGASAGIDAADVSKVDLEVLENDRVRLTMADVSSVTGNLGVGNGVLTANGSKGLVSEESATIELDLRNEADRAAFHHYQLTGTWREGYEPEVQRDVQGTTESGKLGAFGMSAAYESSVLAGEERVDGEVLELVEGNLDEEGQGWSRWDLVDGAAGCLEMAASIEEYNISPIAMDYAKSARGMRKWANDGRAAQAEAQGSVYGSETSQMKVYAGKGTTGQERYDSMQIVQSQRIAFEDRQENAAVMADAADALHDHTDIDRSKLPPHGESTDVWTLETTIDAYGVQNIVELLGSDKPIPGCDFPGMQAVVEARQDFQDAEKSPEAFARVMAEFASLAGPDALEMARVAAREWNTEEYVMLEGSNTWVGRERNETLDRALEERSMKDLHVLRIEERQRLNRLLDPSNHPEVPQEYRDAEVARIRRRLAEWGEVL